ncbi:MAG: hypothetical protein Q7R95_06490, partial [bacterium]|nr:hypothetical protein [bacterium]
KTILIIAILFSPCFISLLWFSNQKNNKVITVQNDDVPVLPQATTIPTPTINYNGKYKNEKLGFSFTYPKNYSLEESESSTYTGITLMSSVNNNISIDVNELKIDIYISPNTDKQSLSEYINSEKKETIDASFFSESNTNIAGYSAKKIIWNDTNYGKSIIYYFLTQDNKVKIIKYNEITTRQSEFNQILSTFKFTESKAVKSIKYNLPENWLSVRDNSQLFEVGYNPLIQDIKMTTLGIEFKDKISNPSQVISNLASYQIVDYNNGSRHTFLYSYFGGKLTNQDKFPDYKEIEYQIDGKTCLFLDGISYSQFPTVWGVCPISSSKALLITTWDRENYSKNLSILKFKI